MPFGGKYRIIDFPLSNCANSGIDTVGVLTQYRPLQLNSYIGSGQAWDMDTSDGGVFILPPYQSAGEKGSWFSGTANAIYQNMFRQKIVDGKQTEVADDWRTSAESWLVPRYDEAVEVRFGGQVSPNWDNYGHYKAEYTGYTAVTAVPRDMKAGAIAIASPLTNSPELSAEKLI